jgi:hypothetical protein
LAGAKRFAIDSGAAVFFTCVLVALAACAISGFAAGLDVGLAEVLAGFLVLGPLLAIFGFLIPIAALQYKRKFRIRKPFCCNAT